MAADLERVGAAFLASTKRIFGADQYERAADLVHARVSESGLTEEQQASAMERAYVLLDAARDRGELDAAAAARIADQVLTP